MSENVHDIFALPVRRETFLARYPRNLKLFVTTILFALAVLPPAWIHGHYRRHGTAIGPMALVKQAEIDASLSGGRGVADVNAPALNDPNDRTVKLIPAPDSRVTEDTEEGPLPQIGEDGSVPWHLYSRPFNMADKRPRISVVVTDLGLSRAITDQAIVQLPPVVTLSFNSQGSVVGAWGTRARQDGHEVLIQIPVEPFDYPQSDPGPDTLLTNLSNSENLARLYKGMRQMPGYIGVTTTLGSRFTSDPTKFDLILQTLRERGLMVFDSRVVPRSIVTNRAKTVGVPVASATQRLDVDLSPDAIDVALQSLEKTARQNGRAIGITAATPLMISKLQAWMETLPEQGIALAPLSAMVQ